MPAKLPGTLQLLLQPSRREAARPWGSTCLRCHLVVLLLPATLEAQAAVTMPLTAPARSLEAAAALDLVAAVRAMLLLPVQLLLPLQRQGVAACGPASLFLPQQPPQLGLLQPASQLEQVSVLATQGVQLAQWAQRAS